MGMIGQHLLNGLMQGTIYGLVAMGFTIFFGVMNVIKFSHGDVLTLGAFGGLRRRLGGECAGTVGAAAVHCRAVRGNGTDRGGRRRHLAFPHRAAAQCAAAQYAADDDDGRYGHP